MISFICLESLSWIFLQLIEWKIWNIYHHYHIHKAYFSQHSSKSMCNTRPSISACENVYFVIGCFVYRHLCKRYVCRYEILSRLSLTVNVILNRRLHPYSMWGLLNNCMSLVACCNYQRTKYKSVLTYLYTVLYKVFNRHEMHVIVQWKTRCNLFICNLIVCMLCIQLGESNEIILLYTWCAEE